ncbi:alcohol dehydrogenase catalytic domain-containing protein [Microbacterium sp. NPDC091313]
MRRALGPTTTAASVNPLDYKIRNGSLQHVLPLAFPVIPGRDAAGIVDAIGSGVSGVAPGDRVFGLGGAIGAYAESVILHTWAVAPDDWSDVDAAAASLTGVTALRALRELGEIDGVLVVHGAGGGVGYAAAAAAVARGVRVIGTARPDDHAALRALGVEPVDRVGAVDDIRALSGGASVSLIDTAGGDSFEEVVTALGNADRAVTVVDPAQARRLGAAYADGQNDAVALAEVPRLGRDGAYRPRIGKVFSLSDAAEAHRAAETRTVRGKIVLRV